MELSFFESEMKRLKEQWPSSYSKERMITFYNAFKDVANFDFRDAVTDCIANSRSAPLLKELTEAVIKAKNNYFHQKRIDEAEQKNAYLNIPDDGTCDKEFKNKCMELYNSFMDKKITRDQFYQGCDLLDQAAKLYKNKTPKTVVSAKQLGRPYTQEEDERPY